LTFRPLICTAGSLRHIAFERYNPVALDCSISDITFGDKAVQIFDIQIFLTAAVVKLQCNVIVRPRRRAVYRVMLAHVTGVVPHVHPFRDDSRISRFPRRAGVLNVTDPTGYHQHDEEKIVSVMRKSGYHD